MRTRIVLGLVMTAAACGALAAAAHPPRDDAGTWGPVSRGAYLVRAGDCRSCHTAANGQAWAGGRAVPTPFGTIYSTNITPDPDTGIGRWSERDFWRAMHKGIDREGKRLYPAFPYPWFTHMSRDDVDAIKAYLDTLAPVRQVNRPNDLAWPMSVRGLMRVWDKLYFDAGVYRSDPKRSTQWNRGAYLVEGPGHCGACHTHKNFAGAADEDHPLQGGHAEHVYAPNLGAGQRDGLGDWNADEIVQYLRTGSNAKSTAAGPMAEVVQQSTQYLDTSDLKAIATYLKSLSGPDRDASARIPSTDRHLTHGAALYRDDCEGCHMHGGTGLADAFPPLRASAAVQADNPDTLIQVVLQGATAPATRLKPTGLAMPAFDDKLSDADVADVLSYVRNTWGNRAPTVSADDVEDVRKALEEQPR